MKHMACVLGLLLAVLALGLPACGLGGGDEYACPNGAPTSCDDIPHEFHNGEHTFYECCVDNHVIYSCEPGFPDVTAHDCWEQFPPENYDGIEVGCIYDRDATGIQCDNGIL